LSNFSERPCDDLRGPMVTRRVAETRSLVRWHLCGQWYGFRLPRRQRALVRRYLYLSDSNIGPGTWSATAIPRQQSISESGDLAARRQEALTASTGGLLFIHFGRRRRVFAQTRELLGPNDGSPSITCTSSSSRASTSVGPTAITVFYPDWYLQKTTGLSAKRTPWTQLNLRFGHISKASRGGIQTLLAFASTLDAPSLRPRDRHGSLLFLIAGGVRWDFKLDLRLYPPVQMYGMLGPYRLKTSIKERR